MDKNYVKLVKAIDMLGESLMAIGTDGSTKPIKLLVSRLINDLGFQNQAIGDNIAMIRFAVENDDESLEKLTAQYTGMDAAEVQQDMQDKMDEAVELEPEPPIKPELEDVEIPEAKTE